MSFLQSKERIQKELLFVFREFVMKFVTVIEEVAFGDPIVKVPINFQELLYH